MAVASTQKIKQNATHGDGAVVAGAVKEAEDGLLASLVDLAKLLDITHLTKVMLREKLEQCSEQKDTIFTTKARKMHEIEVSIRQLDQAIEEKRNLIENEIDLNLKEAMDTLESTQLKIQDVQIAHEILRKKVSLAERSVSELRVQESSMQKEKDRIDQIRSMQSEFGHLREQRHALLEKQLNLAD